MVDTGKMGNDGPARRAGNVGARSSVKESPMPQEGVTTLGNVGNDFRVSAL